MADVTDRMVGAVQYHLMNKAGYLTLTDAAVREIVEIALREQPAPEPVAWTEQREQDRKRFPDPAFNRWLDDGISDSGHTVWDAVGDTTAAWHGWENRQYYDPPQRKPLTDEEIHGCFQQRSRDKATERRLITRAIERAHGIGGEE